MHYFQFYIGDYARSTLHLNDAEDLAYRRLLDMYYDTEAPIPLETQWVARRIRMDTDVVEVVLNDMFKRTKEGWRHSKCDAQIAEYHARAERNRTNGKRGGRPKTANKNPVGSQPEPSRNPNQELVTINQEPIDIDIVQLPLDEEGRADPNAVKVSDVVEYWNEVADRIGKPKVLRLNDTRKQMVKTRIKQNSIDDFLLVFRNIERSSFLRNWKAMGFDWVFKAGNFQKILEGNYND